ncbi:hypothetical protein FRX31_022634 [Thalictrum thalictroides]|uniref:F-box/LRR-repeat protein 15/At3g58940/PEG3-like LRR domain-containing protein n=1 Tax=Thalictrum thalictroides TaxID=46969 RepID=A0A7J6VRR9_THATH|nr:hypothetical protein FRX31_022634 [Thalictrum thalictroides]
MKAATIGTVDELSVNIKVVRSNPLFEFPDQIFKSGIKKLSLCFSYELPKSMCSAEHIKSLRLENVGFPNANLDSRELVLNCPVLENLIVKNCRIHNFRTLTISTPQLKSLEFYKWIYDDCVNKKFCCPKLTSFYWSGNIREDITFKDISALTSVTLKDVCLDDRTDHGIQDEVNFIKHLLKEAKVLTKMVVYFKPEKTISSADRLAEFEQKVLALPAASSNLSISFSSSRML